MGSGDGLNRRTRREFFRYAAGLGAGAAAYAAIGPQLLSTAGAQAAAHGRVRVLVESRVEASSADFARGQARGVAISSAGGRGLLRGSGGGEFVSGVLDLPFPATHLGLHWVMPQDGPGDVALELRSSDGAAWSEWQPAQVETVSELAQGRELFAALLEGNRGRRVQYRISFLSGHTSTVEKVTVTAINSVDGPVLEATAGEPLQTPFTAVDGSSFSVVTRAGWGCDETLRFPGGAESWREMYVPAKKLVIHHTATSNRYSDGAAEVRAIYAYHAYTQGWGDIGYNALIDRYGRIYEGRHGRGEGADREILSAGVVAGHVLGHNYGSSGIAAIGDSSRGDWRSPAALATSLENLVVFECGRHFINPAAASDFLKSSGGWHTGLDNCSGHYQSDATACPGTALKKLLPALRSNAAARLSGGTSPSLTETSGAQRDPAPSSLAFNWSSTAGGPYLYSLEGWNKEDGQDDITYLSGYQEGGYQDGLAKSQLWVQSASTSAAFSGLQPGHYTMHVRTLSGTSADRYEANLTFRVVEGVPPAGVIVAGISPTSLQAGSAGDVSVTGSGFAAGARVEFTNGDGTAPVASDVLVSADGKSISARVSTQSWKRPPKDRVWDVKVTNLDGTSGVLASEFTVTP